MVSLRWLAPGDLVVPMLSRRGCGLYALPVDSARPPLQSDVSLVGPALVLALVTYNSMQRVVLLTPDGVAWSYPEALERVDGKAYVR